LRISVNVRSMSSVRLRGTLLAALVAALGAAACDDGDETVVRDAGAVDAAKMIADVNNQNGDAGQSYTADSGLSPRDGSSGDSSDVGTARDVAATLDAPGDTPPAQPMQALDLVFVVDNSNSMAPKQRAFAQSLGTFFTALANRPGGMPDLRVAVVSTDVGAGASSLPGCAPGGMRGRFVRGGNCGLAAGAPWLTAAKGGANAELLSARVGCIVESLGVVGCGHEHTLQATRLALTPGVNPENEGFVRAEAHLAIVIISDEDDCSAPFNASLFSQPRPGQAESLRCATEGHVCAGSAPETRTFSMELSRCEAAQHDRVLLGVNEFVNSLMSLKPQRTNAVSVAVIAGWPLPGESGTYRIGPRRYDDGTEVIDLLEACRSMLGTATPALRLKAFADAFGPRGLFASICQSPSEVMLKASQHVLAGF
jgi:hypothetical protein